MIIAKADPTIGNHHGALAGKLKAIKIPVITADKSFIVTSLLKAF